MSCLSKIGSFPTVYDSIVLFKSYPLSHSFFMIYPSAIYKVYFYEVPNDAPLVE